MTNDDYLNSFPSPQYMRDLVKEVKKREKERIHDKPYSEEREKEIKRVDRMLMMLGLHALHYWDGEYDEPLVHLSLLRDSHRREIERYLREVS